jgi:hypothetical protein
LESEDSIRRTRKSLQLEGTISQERGLTAPLTFGDPGLLAPFIFPIPSHQEKEEKVDICIDLTNCFDQKEQGRPLYSPLEH